MKLPPVLTIPQNLAQIFAKEITIYGFLVNTILPKYVDEFYKEIPAKLARGELSYLEHRVVGLDHVGDALLAVQKGQNLGKSVVIVADD